jgi:hypothetical protein
VSFAIEGRTHGHKCGDGGYQLCIPVPPSDCARVADDQDRIHAPDAPRFSLSADDSIRVIGIVRNHGLTADAEHELPRETGARNKGTLYALPAVPRRWSARTRLARPSGFR